MTIEELLREVGNHPLVILGYFLIPPIITWLLLRRFKQSYYCTWRDYMCSVLVYLVTLPGIFSILLISYSVFFTHTDLLKVNFLLYFLPIISMTVTLALLRRKIDFTRLPGFERLSGLIIVTTIAFSIVLVLYKTRIFIGFFSSFQNLILFFFLLFLLLKVGAKKLFKA